MKKREVYKNKKATLVSVVISSVGLPLTGDQGAIAEDHIVQVGADEVVRHSSYHFLSSLL